MDGKGYMSEFQPDCIGTYHNFGSVNSSIFIINKLLSSIRHVRTPKIQICLASTQSDQSLSFLPEERLDPLLPIKVPSKTLIRLHRCAG